MSKKVSFDIKSLYFADYLSDEDVGKIFKAAIKYATSNVKDIDTKLMAVALPLFNSIDKSNAISEKRAAAGAVKGKNIGNQNAAKVKPQATSKVDDTKKTENQQTILSIEPMPTKVKAKVKKQGTNVPPTLEEVREYIKQKRYNIDPDHFWNYQEARGWMMGQSKIKNWHCAIATWIKKQKKDNPVLVQQEKSMEIGKKQSGFCIYNNLFDILENGSSRTELKDTPETVSEFIDAVVVG